MAVAFPDLWPEVAGPAADRIGLQQRELAGAILFPDLELGFLLEQPDQHGRLRVHVLLLHLGDELFGDRLVGLGVVGERNFVAVAPGEHKARRNNDRRDERQAGRKHQRRDQRANERATIQCEAPQPLGNPVPRFTTFCP